MKCGVCIATSARHEPVKQSYAVINDLGHGPLDATVRKTARMTIIAHWVSIRMAFLSEFDRAEPTQAITEPKSE